LIISIYAR